MLDWEKAKQVCIENKDFEIHAGLFEDFYWTGGLIFSEGKPVDDQYVYVASFWATPILIIDKGEEKTLVECYKKGDNPHMPNWWGDWEC